MLRTRELRRVLEPVVGLFGGVRRRLADAKLFGRANRRLRRWRMSIVRRRVRYPNVQHAVLLLGLRRRLGRVGRVLGELRRRRANSHVLGGAPRGVRRRKLSAHRRLPGDARVQHAVLPVGLRRRVGRVGRVLGGLRRRRANSHVLGGAARGVRWRKLSVLYRPSRKARVQPAVLPLGLRRRLGRVERVLGGLRRRGADPHVLGGALLVVRRRKLSVRRRLPGDARVQHAVLPLGLRRRLGRVERLLGGVRRWNSISDVLGGALRVVRRRKLSALQRPSGDARV